MEGAFVEHILGCTGGEYVVGEQTAEEGEGGVHVTVPDAVGGGDLVLGSHGEVVVEIFSDLVY